MKTIVVCPECGAERAKYPYDLRRLNSTYCFVCSHPTGPQNPERYTAIMELVKKGVSYAEIGRKLRISRQRVHQIAKDGPV